MKLLKDLGEDNILKQIIFPRFNSNNNNVLIGIGDDCAVFSAKNDQAIVTTMDPCPTPVAFMVANKDYYYYGWMTVIINVSDLASVGAEPIGMTVSTVMPEDMPVYDYERFLDGLSDASKLFVCPLIGGNIKDGKEFTATGSAFGSIDPKKMMLRKGAKPGDLICVIGEMGLFWASVISYLKKITIDGNYQSILDTALFEPTPKIFEGIQLSKINALTSCMDSSDGISSCLFTLAKSSEVDFEVDLKLLEPHPALRAIADKVGHDFKKYMMSWGGWELVGTIAPESVAAAKDKISMLGTTFSIIGRVTEGDGNVWALDKGEIGLLTDFGSYRFCATSYFSHGIEAYIDYLVNMPLYSSQNQRCM